MEVIGLTGGIASGKSTVSSILRSLGAFIIDADVVSREIMIKGTKTYNILVNEFGKEILRKDGEIDRKKLGNLVFADKQKLNRLNEITHPEIIRRIKEIIEEERKNGKEKAIILDAALLIEMRLFNMVDEVWLVVVDKKTQIRRLMKRDNLNYNDALNRIKSQMSIEDKMKYADFIINNCKDFNAIKKQVELLWGRFSK
ncbi:MULTISPECIES: dephospho-CoA kinase [Thermoanaerobacterium]|uniref:Dephospho-CoA kinase n=4 Tax=Thermoanaerobacterium TaxID=28895 RepID=D9TNL7_THETC|nr:MULTISPECIES: dephospho-CoA kinase [Thermoanaerobacterium]TCW41932.1 dephospho-CoA kinase [Thermohydrogenium kirishiense]ADL68623.1 dephospho-CoA kinase [Thermoanaerobacterium thermosaccharolyticum DSM 571]KAA5806785.1 dephospho-CoA kinase [Thermoanaerobacterium thermosaccharolyticum]MBE0067558.1 dephospho-CoA kinase [Thermoanaerobacterium thermosaccharolyticum]MBE0228846.1 dephospho-CoA kinase [Thermoanaerobacterium thermosaccharolyticum]